MPSDNMSRPLTSKCDLDLRGTDLGFALNIPPYDEHSCLGILNSIHLCSGQTHFSQNFTFDLQVWFCARDFKFHPQIEEFCSGQTNQYTRMDGLTHVQTLPLWRLCRAHGMQSWQKVDIWVGFLNPIYMIIIIYTRLGPLNIGKNW